MKELSPPMIEALLNEKVVGRIGCHADGTTYVVPVTYAYDGNYIYVHSAKGMKIAIIQKSPDVCFQVDDIQNLANWRSVIIWGRFEEIHHQERANAMKLLVDRIMALLTDEAGMPAYGATQHAQAAMSDEALWYRIKIGKKTGRYEIK